MPKRTDFIRVAFLALAVPLTAAAQIQPAVQPGGDIPARATPAGFWVEGFFFDDTKVQDKRALNVHDLDQVSREHPVSVRHRGGHTTYYNSKAFELAGVTRNTPNSAAGTFVLGFRNIFFLGDSTAVSLEVNDDQTITARIEQSLRADPQPGRAMLNWLWLSLGNQRLGKTEEARRWLDKAQSWLDQFKDGMPARAEQEFGLDFHNWLEAYVLRREAEALIQSTGPRSRPENR